jgi:PPOX class probable F420-dependent enzyme
VELDDAMAWVAAHKHAVLITLRRDGRAQSSDIAYTVADGVVEISLTDGRAKTANMRRDPRVVLHITDPGSWSYVSLDGTAELTPVTQAPDDATADALVRYYERVAGGPHPDWAEYRSAMVDEGRLLARFTPTSAVGQIH